jgi:hypothetical protein
VCRVYHTPEVNECLYLKSHSAASNMDGSPSRQTRSPCSLSAPQAERLPTALLLVVEHHCSVALPLACFCLQNTVIFVIELLHFPLPFSQTSGYTYSCIWEKRPKTEKARQILPPAYGRCFGVPGLATSSTKEQLSLTCGSGVLVCLLACLVVPFRASARTGSMYSLWSVFPLSP